MSRQSRIAAAKRNEFQQKQQVNRLYAQKIQAGMTPAQASVTLTDGQTLDQLAAQNGVGVTDILNANPDMTAPKTGMVLNVPNNYNINMRSRGYAPGKTKDDLYGGGLPSNSALGGLSTNAVNQVPNNYNQDQRGRTFGQPAPSPYQPFGSLNQKLPYSPASTQYNPPSSFSGSVGLPGGMGQSQIDAARTALQTGQAQVSAPAIKMAGTAFAPTFRTKDDYLPTQIAALAHMDTYKPTDYELKYLERYGMITKTPQPAFSSGYGRRRGGRGGGSGSGVGTGKTPKATQQADRLPAFSSGGGFNGLVNWRI